VNNHAWLLILGVAKNNDSLGMLLKFQSGSLNFLEMFKTISSWLASH